MSEIKATLPAANDIDQENSSWTNEKTGDYVSLTCSKINSEHLINIAKSNQAGAVSIFLGTTRDIFEDKIVTSLCYEAYNEMAIASMIEIIDKIRAKWNVTRIVIEHKLGDCPIGETSICIAISSEHRKESLESVHFAIDELKKAVPIWKKEKYLEGDSKWKSNNESISFQINCESVFNKSI